MNDFKVVSVVSAIFTNLIESFLSLNLFLFQNVEVNPIDRMGGTPAEVMHYVFFDFYSV